MLWIFVMFDILKLEYGKRVYPTEHIWKAIYLAKFGVFLSSIDKYVVCLFEWYLFPFF